MEQYNTQEHELSWDSEITKDSQEFVDVPDGDYDFMVEKLERGRYNGGEKISACPQAIITLVVNVPKGEQARMTEKLMLHSKCEWRLSQFFASLGLKQKDQPLKMNWNITGLKGRMKVGHKQYEGKSYNEIKKFYARWELNDQNNPPQQNNSYQVNSSNNGYTPGKF